MSTPFDISIAEQESVISAAFNSFLVLLFLMGVYTMVYAGTMYLYLSKKAQSANRYLVLSVISVLYIFCLGITVIQWYSLQLAVIKNGETRQSVFIAVLEGGPVGPFILLNFFSYGLFPVSDGLLIWRCYNVWGRSLVILSILLILLLANTGLFITEVIMTGLFASLTVTSAQASLAIRVRGAQLFMSFGTTVITTSLIAYRMLSPYSYRHTSSKRVFKRLLIVMLESAALYSVLILVYAVQYMSPSALVLGPVQIEQAYMQVFVAIVGGMAPTILVARLVVTDPNSTEGPTHMSGIQFQTQRATGQSEVLENGGDSNDSVVDGGDGGKQDEEKKVTLAV